MSEKKTVLELRKVNKSFGPIDVLHDISIKVNAGEVLCLLGDNGAGKSTLIKTLAGVHKPTSGEIHMDGVLASFATPREAAEISNHASGIVVAKTGTAVTSRDELLASFPE